LPVSKACVMRPSVSSSVGMLKGKRGFTGSPTPKISRKPQKIFKQGNASSNDQSQLRETTE